MKISLAKPCHLLKLLPLLLLLAAACIEDGENLNNGEYFDSGMDSDQVQPDMGSDAAVDMAETDMPEIEAEWSRFELSDGSTLDGEIVAVYDTSLWWAPLDGLLYAVFDSSAYAPYPNDRSIRLLLASEVSSISDSPAVVRHTPYQSFLRQRGMYFRRPPLSGPNFVINGNESYHLEEDGYGDFAWDFVVTNLAGERYQNQGQANEDYLVWDRPVLSGVSGEVIDIVRSGEDNVPGSHPPTDVAVNNMVGVALGGSYYAYYLHFREDGIDPDIEVGTWVEPGDVLGRAGNSGVSLEPHIHVVVLWFDVEAQRSYAVPAEFTNLEVAGSVAGLFELQVWWKPSTGEWVSRPM